MDATESDIAVLYLKDNQYDHCYRRYYQRGRYEVPPKLDPEQGSIIFLEDCGQVLLLPKRDRDFELFLLHPDMTSALVLPLKQNNNLEGFLILNARESDWYGKDDLAFADGYCESVASLLFNIELFQSLKQKMKAIDDLQRYQERVFNSMTNLLLTTDGEGKLAYYNDQAARTLALKEEDLGRPYSDLFKGKVTKKAINLMNKALDTGKEFLGYEGIYKTEPRDIDFSLNISPLLGKRGKKEGLTMILTDQSREKALASEMANVKEDRRIIKDMFSRYLSQDVVQHLMEQPDLVKLGGDKKAATLFFADIRGYTSFSEGKDPAYIVDVLNDYFSQAVDVIIQYNGYIDKFIGDCIMAAWGVPMYSEAQDARKAVTCALAVQELVNNKKRDFFKGEAKHLQIGIGMNSGPLVAGNLGSQSRMDYSIIGDTVNVAARLEGIAKGGEVIINHTTRDLLGDHFKLEELTPVKVKGKEKPLPIFKVLKLVS